MSTNERATKTAECSVPALTPEGRPLMNTPLWDACAVVIATARAIPVHHVGPRMVDDFWDAAQKSGVLSCMSKPGSQTAPAGLPPGYRILNDGPGREVLFREEWDEGDVCGTIEEAVERARWLEGLS